MGNVQIHESLANVVNNGDGTFTITRDKLIALVQGQAFLDVYDNADVNEVDSGMDDAYHYALGATTSRRGITQSIRLMRSRASRATDADCVTHAGIGFPRG